MKKVIIFCIFFLVISVTAYCGQTSRVELTDGSVVNGEVVSFTGGVYTINTANFGEVKVPAGKIYKIISSGPISTGMQTGSSEKSGDLTQQMSALKEKVMNNPENTAMITGLANNPQIQNIAEDPEILQAAQSGDIQALLKNKKFNELVNDPKIQETVKKLKQKE